jgi:hypothetical protein
MRDLTGHHSGVSKRSEQGFVQALVTQAAAEALHEGVLLLGQVETLLA